MANNTGPVEHDALYWESSVRGVRCSLCPHRCLIAEGRHGRCLGRTNRGGRLFADSYGRAVSLAVDPVEKKPLYHFLPGSEILSVATYGCNLACPFCQNSEISQAAAPSRYLSPEALVAAARERSIPSVAFTYSEPLVWFEYVVDAARLLRGAGVRVVLVTNGMANAEPFAELLPLVDAMNIDLKAMRPDFYRDYVRGDLASVLATIRAARSRCHVELTNLLIPGRNDSDDDVDRLVDFVCETGQSTPLHFSRYFPRFRATEPATPAESLLRAAERASLRLHYVYLGNLDCGSRFRDTTCPGCGNVLVDRAGYSGRVVGITAGACANCGRRADFLL